MARVIKEKILGNVVKFARVKAAFFSLVLFTIIKISALVSFGVALFLLSMNIPAIGGSAIGGSVAYAKDIPSTPLSQPQANRQEQANRRLQTNKQAQTSVNQDLHIKQIAILTNQRTVRTQNEYVFTKQPVSLLITLDGMSSARARNLRKVTVTVGRYQVVNGNAELAKTEVISALVNFQYRLRPSVLGKVKIYLQKEGVYDLHDVSVSAASVTTRPKRIWGGGDDEQNFAKETKYFAKHTKNVAKQIKRVAKYAAHAAKQAKIYGKKMRLNKPILSVPSAAHSIAGYSQDNADTETQRYIVIDRTPPVLSVNYDNNSSYEGKYFRAGRSARILIKDDSFIFSYMLHNPQQIARIFADNKQVLSLTAKNLKNDGIHPNVWYADIPFSKDAAWDAQYFVQDLCGNASNTQNHNFVIDTHPPTIAISGVQQGGAYSHGINPSIVIKDRWLKPESVKYNLRRIRNAKDLRYSKASINSNVASVQYADFYHGSKDNDVYQLQWSAKDAVNHEIGGTLQFSINNKGSDFSIDSATSKMNNQQLQYAKDVHIEEVNPSGLNKAPKISIMQDGVEKVLSKKDFSVTKRADRGWQRFIYTIFKRNFAENAHYKVLINSVDRAGNQSCNESGVDSKNGILQSSPASVQFSVDHLAPIATVFDMENNTIYRANKKGKLVRIAAKDNSSLKSVTFNIDGKTKHTWTGKSANKPILSVKMEPDGIAHDVLVEASDYAGNITTVQYNKVKVVQISQKTIKSKPNKKRNTSKNSSKSNKGNKGNRNVKSDENAEKIESGENVNEDEIANSKVQNLDSAASNSSNALPKKSSNLLIVLAYIGIAAVALLCVALGVGIFYNKRLCTAKDD